MSQSTPAGKGRKTEFSLLMMGWKDDKSSYIEKMEIFFPICSENLSTKLKDCVENGIDVDFTHLSLSPPSSLPILLPLHLLDSMHQLNWGHQL